MADPHPWQPGSGRLPRPPGKVIGTPTLPPFLLSGRPHRRRLPPLFRGDRVRFYHQGRYALWHALRAMGVGPGDNVLFPALHCATELDPLLHLGIEPRFYEAEADLTVEPGRLERLLDAATRAVLVIRYFGFDQPIGEMADFCRRHGLRLIEDCAHTLPDAGNGVGSFGDVSVFSLRKLLPMPDGGALCVNTASLPVPDPPPLQPPMLATLREVRRKVARGLERRPGGVLRAGLERFVRPVLAALRRGGPEPGSTGARPGHDPYAFHAARLGWSASRLSTAILRATSLAEVADRRRRNFTWLRENVRPGPGVRLVPGTLPGDGCPWLFPILTERPQDLIAHMLRQGVEVGPFWQYCHPAFPASRFPLAAGLKARLLGLPVHQQLTSMDLERITAALSSWSPP